jgi:hypothetical protein
VDKFFIRRKEADIHPSGVFTGLRIFQSILIWLAGLVWITEEEQQEAGIILRDQRYR